MHHNTETSRASGKAASTAGSHLQPARQRRCGNGSRNDQKMFQGSMQSHKSKPGQANRGKSRQLQHSQRAGWHPPQHRDRMVRIWCPSHFCLSPWFVVIVSPAPGHSRLPLKLAIREPLIPWPSPCPSASGGLSLCPVTWSSGWSPRHHNSTWKLSCSLGVVS